MKENRSFALLIVWMLFVVSLMVNVWQCGSADRETEADTARVIVVDTVVYHAPEAKEERSKGSVVVAMPVSLSPDPSPIGKGNGGRNGKNGCNDDRKLVRKNDRKISVAEEVETLISPDFGGISGKDSVYVEVPITQKVYADNTYRAVVSGYGVCLDTMFVYPRTEIVTIRQKPKRWSFGVQAGYGVMFQGKMVGAPYVGVGISCRLFDI